MKQYVPTFVANKKRCVHFLNRKDEAMVMVVCKTLSSQRYLCGTTKRESDKYLGPRQASMVQFFAKQLMISARKTYKI